MNVRDRAISESEQVPAKSELPWHNIRVQLSSSTGFHIRPPDTPIPKRWFRSSLVDFDLWVIHGGEELLLDSNGNTHLLKRNTLALFKPDEVWSTQPTGSKARSSRHSYVHFDLINRKTGKRIAKQFYSHLPSVIESTELRVIEAILSKVIQLNRSLSQSPPHLKESRGELAENLMHGLLQIILDPALACSADPHPNNDRSHIQRHICKKILEQLQSDPKSYPDVSSMAREMNLSKAYFSRFFRKVTGTCPQEAINTARTDRAKLLLTHSNYSLGRIADECGYQSTYYFCRQFKKQTGEPPGRYRSRKQRGTSPQ